MLRWYLVRTKPSRESTAQLNLRRQGFEVYLPLMTQSVRRHGRWQERVVPVFPAYLFLRLKEGEQSLGPVRSSVGVLGIVRFGASYALVPEQVIAGLRARANPQTGLHRLADSTLPPVGSEVRITMGPFEGLEGIFQRPAGPDRVVILLRLLGHTAAVRIPVDFVLPRRTGT
jgi:transcriptional antiterminator RfaH